MNIDGWNAHIARGEQIFEALIAPGSASFAEMAVALRVQAHDNAFQLDHASNFSQLAGTDGIRRATWELSSRARMIGCAHLLLKELIPHEDAVRALLQRPAPAVGFVLRPTTQPGGGHGIR